MTKNATRRQYAALPYRRSGDVMEVMLITSRDTGRWVIPKGWPAAALSPSRSAEREAMEEGGLVGRISSRSIGAYRYAKRLNDGSEVSCVVEVFPLAVKKQLKKWPEKAQRRALWFPLPDAAAAVQETDLGEIIRNLDSLIA